jgi:hypothetical protein
VLRARRDLPSRLTRFAPGAADLLGFLQKMCPNSNKTEKNRKKPVETEEKRLTKRLEKLKVNCGTVLRTRMNTEDSQERQVRFSALSGIRVSGCETLFSKARRSNTQWQKE